MTRREVIEAIVKAANDKINEFSPRSINGMNVKWTCELTGVHFNTPIIKIRVRSHRLIVGHPRSIDRAFGVGFAQAIEMLQEIRPIPDQEDYMSSLITNGDQIVDYYSRALADKIEAAFLEYCRQIRRYDEEEEVLASEDVKTDLPE